MTKQDFGSGIALLVALFTLTGVVTVYSAGLELVRSKVIKRDSRGRVEIMEIRATDGICTAEIRYGYNKRPRIHVTALSRLGVRTLEPPMELEDETEETLSNEVLMGNFNLAMEYCKPFIIKGYVRV